MIDDAPPDEADFNQDNYHYKLRAISDYPKEYTLIDHDCIKRNMRDQGSCGSCWATATAVALSMRRCLKFGDKQQISIQEFVACSNNSMYGVTNKGCWGGHPLPAMQHSYLTGTPYESCYAYTQHKASYPYKNVSCQSTCDDGSPKKMIYTSAPRRLKGEEAIMREIYENGPVASSFYLYSDFVSQIKNDGIYALTQNSTRQGGHAVVLIGWGERDGVKYWQAQNTYGPSWHNGGYFKIRRGQNDARIENEAAAADVLGDPVQEAGSFDVADVWLTGNRIALKYASLEACELRLNSTAVANLSGSGTYTYALTAQPGSYKLSCGSVSKTITVMAYTPKFSQETFSGEPGKTTRIQFSSSSGLSQRIQCGSQSATTTAGYADFVLDAGEYTAVLTTVGTAPTLSASVPVKVAARDDRSWTALAQPGDCLVGETQRFVLKVRYIESIYVTVQNSLGAVLYEETWLSSGSLAEEQNATFAFTPTDAGTYYFKARTGDMTIVSSTFTVSLNLQEITSPLESQLILQGTTVTITATALNNEQVYLNHILLGTLTKGSLTWKVSQTPDTYQIRIGTQFVNVIVAPTPRFSKSVYEIKQGESIDVELTSSPAFVFDNYVTLTYKGTPLRLQNNAVKIASTATATAGEGMLKLELVYPYEYFSASATVRISSAEHTCAVTLAEDKALFGFPVSFTSTCSNSTFTVWDQNGYSLLNATQFTPPRPGNYRICAGKTCSAQFYAEGLRIQSFPSTVASLASANIAWRMSPTYTGNLLVQYYCKDDDTQQWLGLVPAQQKEVTVYFPSLDACTNAALRLRTEKTPYYYGDVLFALTKHGVERDSLHTPFQKDPALSETIVPVFNETTPDDPVTPAPEPEPDPEPEPEPEPDAPEEQPETGPFVGYYPKGHTLKAGQKITVRWTTTLASTNNVTVILYRGTPGAQTLIQTYTRTAPNSGSYELTLPANLTSGAYYFIIRTVDKGTTKYSDQLFLTIQ